MQFIVALTGGWSLYALYEKGPPRPVVVHKTHRIGDVLTTAEDFQRTRDWTALIRQYLDDARGPNKLTGQWRNHAIETAETALHQLQAANEKEVA